MQSIRPRPLIGPVSTHEARLGRIAAALRRGELDPTTYVEACCDRVDELDGELHAMVDEPDRRGRLSRDAAALENRYPGLDDRPPLYGVPVGVKDIFHAEGLRTRANTGLPPEELTGEQGSAVTRLVDAGALVFGKTVTTEFAYFSPGPTRNPHDLGHTPGGSSSGSAAGVAAGMFPLAIGSQTAGSTVRPAAFCGIVGFKPTHGRIPTDGVIDLAPSLDTVGVFAQDVAGAGLAARVLCDDWDPDRSVAGRPTLGVPHRGYVERASDVAVARFERQVDVLEGAGYDVVEAPALEDTDVYEQHATLMAAEAALSHQEWYAAYADRYEAVMVDLIEEGRGTSVGDLADAGVGRGRLRATIEDLMDDSGVDAWISPAAPGPAPAGIESTGDPVMNAPWTYAGVPALTVPAGEVDGLPIGLQCTAAGGDGERLLAWGGPIAEVMAGIE